jgi:hypothetical protein
MKLSRNMKQNGTTGVISVITLVLHAILVMYGGGEIEFADTLAFELGGQSLPDLLDNTGKEKVPVEFNSDMVLPSDHRVRLKGSIGLVVKPGDLLVFRKENDSWVEVFRDLTE